MGHNFKGQATLGDLPVCVMRYLLSLVRTKRGAYDLGHLQHLGRYLASWVVHSVEQWMTFPFGFKHLESPCFFDHISPSYLSCISLNWWYDSCLLVKQKKRSIRHCLNFRKSTWLQSKLIARSWYPYRLNAYSCWLNTKISWCIPHVSRLNGLNPSLSSYVLCRREWCINRYSLSYY